MGLCGNFTLFFLFLRAIINIPIQTLIISPWLLFRKMIISQLELESPVHAAALVAFFSRIERQFTSENFHAKRKKTLSTTTNLNSPLLTLYFRPDIVWRLLIRPFSYPQICIKFKNLQACFAGARNRYCPSDRNCRCVMKVYRYYLSRPNKVCLSYMYVKAT